ncbi:hypothetical protein [Brevundimonas mediterranea]|uniref:Uncharacterized protein n=1 Tax=Brevundimonas mediterranea TaxID=74329 RepID=A0A7W6A6B4_9CAUL|nr:hypothetical protein [Brevundimonas mediterranea]MBB3872495.1 hypothetical protein [Brevundimonas mediterranea]
MAFDGTPLQTAVRVGRANVSLPQNPLPTEVYRTRGEERIAGSFETAQLDDDDRFNSAQEHPALQVRLPRADLATVKPLSLGRLQVLQSWEGFVMEINDTEGTFGARLADLTDEENTEEYAEFDLSEVDSDDQELLRVGGVFRWLIGYRENQFGRRERVSSIVFRRLPAWTARDLEAAKAEGAAVANALLWD